MPKSEQIRVRAVLLNVDSGEMILLRGRGSCDIYICSFRNYYITL